MSTFLKQKDTFGFSYEQYLQFKKEIKETLIDLSKFDNNNEYKELTNIDKENDIFYEYLFFLNYSKWIILNISNFNDNKMIIEELLRLKIYQKQNLHKNILKILFHFHLYLLIKIEENIYYITNSSDDGIMIKTKLKEINESYQILIQILITLLKLYKKLIFTITEYFLFTNSIIVFINKRKSLNDKYLKLKNMVMFDLLFNKYFTQILNIINNQQNNLESKNDISLLFDYVIKYLQSKELKSNFNYSILCNNGIIQKFLTSLFDKIDFNNDIEIYNKYKLSLIDCIANIFKYNRGQTNFFEILLNHNKKSFIHLVNYKSRKDFITKNLYEYNFYLEVLNKLFMNEQNKINNKNKNNIVLPPENSFIFNGFDSKITLKLNKFSLENSILIFSFQFNNELKTDINYPLIIFETSGEEIIFKLFIKNENNTNKLFFFQKKKDKTQNIICFDKIDILPDINYFLGIMWQEKNIIIKIKKVDDKGEQYYEEKKKIINFENHSSNMKIGHDDKHKEFFKGYIGSLIIIKNLSVNKEINIEKIISNILEMKNHYKLFPYIIDKINTTDKFVIFDFINYFLFYSTKTENEIKNIIKNLKKNILGFDCTLYLIPEILNVYSSLFWQNKGIFTLPVVPYISPSQNNYFVIDMNVSLTKINNIFSEFQKNNGFYYFCLVYEYFYQLANNIINMNEFNINLNDNKLELTIINSINSTLSILYNYIDYKIVLYNLKSFKTLFRNIYEALKKLKKISNNIIPKVISSAFKLFLEFKSEAIVYQKSLINSKISNNIAEKIILSFSDGLVEMIYDTELYENYITDEYINMLFILSQSFIMNYISDSKKINEPPFKPNFIFKILNFTKLLEKLFTNDYKNKPKTIESYFKFLKYFFKTIINDKNGTLFFKKLIPFSVINYENNLTVSYNYLKFIHELLWEGYCLQKADIEILMNYLNNLEKRNTETDNSLIVQLNSVIATILVKSSFPNIYDDIKIYLNSKFETFISNEKILSNIIFELRRIFEKLIKIGIDEFKNVMIKKNKTNDIDYIDIFQNIFIFIIDIFNFLINKCEEASKRNEEENETENEVRERSFVELFSLLDRVTESLKNELKSKGVNSYRMYCLINYIKFFHNIIFNEKQIFEVSEKAFTDNLIKIILLSSQYCLLNCNQLFKIKVGNIEYNKTIIEIIFEMYMQYILNCKESIESFKNLLLNFDSFFYDNDFKADKKYSIFYSNNYLRYLLSQKKVKEKTESILLKYNTILNYNKNIFKIEDKFENNFNTYFLSIIIDTQKKIQDNNNLNKQLTERLIIFINNLFSSVLQEHSILYNKDKNFFFKTTSSAYYNEQINYIKDRFIKKNIPIEDVKSYLLEKMAQNKLVSKDSKEENNDTPNEYQEKKKNFQIDLKERLEPVYYKEDNTLQIAPFIFSKETYQIQFFNNLDKNYVTNIKKDLMNNIFSLYYIDEFFYNKDFSIMKKYYNNFINLRAINESKQLDYPSILKNYRNNLEPGIFIKQFNNYFSDPFLKVTHKYIENHKELKKYLSEKKSIKLEQKEFHDFEGDKEIECELLKNENTFYGKLIYNDSGNYLLFKEEFKDFTKEEEPYKYLFLMEHYWQNDNKKKPKAKIFRKKLRKKNVLLLLDDIEELVEMRIMHLWKGLEIYEKKGKSYLFNFLNTTEYENFLKDFLLKCKIKSLIRRKSFLTEKSNLYKEWVKGLISNHEYILLLNRYGSRSFNDPEQYPIFPWILNNYKNLEYFNNNENFFLQALKENIRLKEENEEINMNKMKKQNTSKMQKFIEIKSFILDGKYEQAYTLFEDKKSLTNEQLYDVINIILKNVKKILRDFNYPISLQSEDKRAIAISKYEEDEEENSKFPIHSGCHYANSAYVYFYLMRQQPYDNLIVRLQEYNLEDVNRCFISISTLQTITLTGNDNRELIPEFFSRIEFLLNLNYDFYGILYLKDYNLDDCEIDIFNKDIIHSLSIYVNFVLQHKRILNSKVIGYFLNQWFDIIFGVNQLQSDKEKRKKSCNVFSKYTYEKNFNLESKLEKNLKKETPQKQILEKIKLSISQLINFGMTPPQLFHYPHEVLNISTKNEKLNNSKSNANNEELNKDFLEEEDEGDFESFINKNIRLENLEAQVSGVPIYFDINPTINKIFVYNSKDNLIIYDCQLFNETNFKYFNLSLHASIDNPNIFYSTDLSYNSIYEIKYGFSSFDNEIKYNINEFNNYNDFHTYYFNKINFWLNKGSIDDSHNTIEDFKFITCRHIDLSFKIHYFTIQYKKKEKIHLEKVFSFQSEDFVSACCCTSNNTFIIGLKNGKLISYKLKITKVNTSSDKKNKNINIQDENLYIRKDKYIKAHHGKINTIEIDKKLGIIITSGDDNYILIRKLYDFELLTPIKLKNKYKVLMTKISSFNFLYILSLNIINNKKIIFGYTLSGIRFAKSEYGFYDNICITDDGDIFTLDNKKIITFLSGSNLKKLNKLKNENNIEALNKIKQSNWMQLNCFIRNDEENMSRIITYLYEDIENFIKTLNLENF